MTRPTHWRASGAPVSFFPIVEQVFGEDAKKRVLQFQVMTDFGTAGGVAQRLLLEFG